MTELYLKFTDQNGEEKDILVEGEEFIIGRHSDNDLCIINSQLSRQHIKIERFGDIYVVSDLGSSNGTTFNETELTDPESLNDGDILNLGGGLTIEVELVSDDPNANNGSAKNSNQEKNNKKDDAESSKQSSPSTSVGATGQSKSSSGLGIFFILAPLMGLAVILMIGGGMYFFSDRGGTEVAKNEDEFIFTTDEDSEFLEDLPENLSSENTSTTLTQTKTPEPTVAPPNGTQTPQTNPSNPPDSNPPTKTANLPTDIETISTPKKIEVSETDKIRGLSLSLMRRIAHNDPRPVLTTKQLSVINSKIKQYKGSAVLATNIKNAKSNASQIASLATSNNLKPQFLATAALSKLGKSQGDVLATAQGMVGVLQNLNIHIGTNLANDSLLLIAAYNQGVAGQERKMRDKLGKLTTKHQNVSSRQVRTIWFLRDQNELTNEELELALRFLAIGTITQNPKAFNVNSTALTFN